MILDIRTIFIITFLHNSIMGVGLFIVAREYSGPIRRSMLLWGRAIIIMMAGWILLGLRDIIPDFISMVVANSLLLAGMSEIIRAIRIFNGQPVRNTPYYEIIAVAILLLTIFTFIFNSLTIRIIIASFIVVALDSYVAWILISPASTMRSTTRRITSLGFLLLAIVFLIRAIYTLINPSESTSFINNTGIQTIIFSVLAMAMLMTTYSFLLVCNEYINNELKTHTITDWLTGIFNRRAFQELALHEVARIQRNRHPLTILLIDIDHFKGINDSYGHEAGDSVLKMVANTLTKNVRLQDIVGRFGGDEFAVLLPETGQEMADTIKTRLEQEIQQATTTYQGKDIKVTISVGAGTLNPDNPDYDDMVRRADTKLYEEKESNYQLW